MGNKSSSSTGSTSRPSSNVQSGSKGSHSSALQDTPFPSLFKGPSPIPFSQAQLVNAKKTRILQLQSRGLKALPPQLIDEISDVLRNLDLSRNKLKELGPSIRQFLALKQLRLSANQLSILPDEIGTLKALELLDVSQNFLCSLPTTLSNCAQLTSINASSNKLVQFPVVITQISRLEEVKLADNLIVELPPEIGNLAATELDLCRNRLSTLHSNLAKCSRLKILRVDENCLPANAFSEQLLEHSGLSLISHAGNLFLEKEFQTLPGYHAYEDRFTAIRRKMF